MILKKTKYFSGTSALISVFSVLLSLFAFFTSKEANRISKEANTIATESKNISKAGLDFSRETQSQIRVESAYMELYENKEISGTMEKIRQGKIVGDRNKLMRVIDQFESIGGLYCQGSVWNWHINTVLKNSLSYICNNDEVFQTFSGKKNGTAILCREYFPDSKFAQTLKQENLSTCLFYDSSVFPSTKWNQ